MNAGFIVILALLGLSFLGIPIYLALGIGTLIALNVADMPLIVLPQKLFAGMNSSSLLAIPFFMLAGNIMSRSITGKLIDVSNALIGWIKGSLAVVTVLASALFGAISGSGVATASAVGGTTIPAMKEEGYPPHFAAAISGIASILGPIIPPSITLIVYASITDLSVSKLFMGSVLPGVLMAGGLILYALFYGKKNDLPAHPRKKPKEIALTFKDGIWALLMPVIILGGIFGGIFTPTESAAVAVVYALAISLFIYKDMKMKDIFGVFVEGAIGTATILMLVGLSKASSYVVTTSGLPQQVLEGFSSITSSKIIILLLLNLMFFIIGMLMEANAAIIMMTPILLPLLSAFGIDTMQFGIIMSMNLCIGLVTPPVGICLLMTNQIAKASFVQTLRSLLPMLIISIIVLLLVTFIPQVTLWLPSLIQ
ncbi:TRAP transporter large permease [Anaerotignum sp.]|uniref:TRAP transporter large permease n=1 Tax=Anaerotignum sp. TaxID=2039241 RepID=UPI002714C2FD|nr:TRAP transporter large permease [Anaerotignum sp.]